MAYLYRTNVHMVQMTLRFGGHPRLRRETIELELGELFDIVSVAEGVYDMKFSGPKEEWDAAGATEWNYQHGGVLAWTLLLRRKKERVPPRGRSG